METHGDSWRLMETHGDLPKALITLPKAKRPQLMEMPSFALSPVAPVRLSRSEPAKSTKWNLAVSVSMSPTLVEPSLVFSSSSSKWNGFSFLACRCCCKNKQRICKQISVSVKTNSYHSFPYVKNICYNSLFHLFYI